MTNLDKQLFTVGIDVGGTSLKCGLVAENGEIVHQKIISLHDALSEKAIILKMAQVIEDFAMRTDEILGVGIGFPGLVEENVVIGGAENLPGFNQTPLGDILKDVTGIANIVIDNDANLMGLGELHYGAAKNCSDVIFLTVGTGIGGTALINGKLFGGYRNRGAEMGHIVVMHNGEPCACGNKGCLESYASVNSLIKYYNGLKEIDDIQVDGRYIIDKFLAGEAIAIDAMNRHFDYLSSGLVSLINVFSPQKIIVGGGISEAGPFYIQELSKRVMDRALPMACRHVLIEAAKLGNSAGLMGAAQQAFLKFKTYSYTS